MKKSLCIIFILLLITVTIMGCTISQEEQEEEKNTSLLEADWENVVSQSKGQTVNLHMWGGDPAVNEYMDGWVAPKLKEEYDITLNRVPITDPKDMLNKLLTEEEVGKKEGTIDMMWINEENFKIAKDNQLLWGPFVEQLPNFQQYVDGQAEEIRYDFGEDTQGLEAPWGRAQFVLIYDEEKVESPPTSMEELQDWVKENPGKFTYPAPPDFTGSAFIRHALYETTGGYEKYMEIMKEEQFTKETLPLWDYLNSIEPYLWREGKTYPESNAKLDQLFGSGEVWMTMSYTPTYAANKVKSGDFPVSSRTFVLEQGTLANTHYLSIPFNATNKAGAMTIINFLLSPAAQIEKFNPNNWGDGFVLSVDKLSKEEQQLLESMDSGETVLPPEELQKHRVPEIPSVYMDLIEKGWVENVAK